MSYLTDSVDEIFQEWNTLDTPGCALLIAQHGEPLYVQGYGMANIEYGRPITSKTIFHVASVSKQFTAMIIALLAQDGKLSLDDDVHKYLPEIPDYGTPVTIKQLIYQTHGMRDQEELLYLAGWRRNDLKTNRDAFSLITRQKRLNFTPGERRVYNSSGYTCLALIAERVTGQPLRELAAKNIFEPLNMTHSHFHDDYTLPIDNMASSYIPAADGKFHIYPSSCYLVGTAGLYTTAEDLKRWLENFHTCSVGGNAVIQQMLTPGTLNDGKPISYAFGNSISDYRGITMVRHPGLDGGYQARIAWCPEHDFMIIMLCNLSSIKPWALSRKIIDMYLEKYLTPVGIEGIPWEHNITLEIPPFPTTLHSLDNAQLPAYTGIYYSRELNVIYAIFIQEHQLMLRRQKFVDCILALHHEDSFLFEGENGWGEATILLEFFRNGDGSVDGFSVSSPNALDIRFEKIE